MTQDPKKDSDEPPSETKMKNNQVITLDLIERVKQSIWKRRPILGEIMQKHGQKTLYDYSKDFLDVNKSSLLDARKEELLVVVKGLLAKRLNEQVAEEVCDQLRQLALVSTADHHGPINHAFFLNSNIISGIPFFESKTEKRYLIDFSFASVSTNNGSNFSRGIIFHGGDNCSGNLVRLPILPDKLKMGTVYGMRAFNKEDLAKADTEIIKKEKTGEIALKRGEKVRECLKTYFANDNVLSAEDLTEQITKINYRMWDKFFHPAASNGCKIPSLIYLDIESIVTTLLLEKHLQDPSSLIYRFLFNPKSKDLILKLFNNLPGAFSVEKEWGSYMFWAMDDKKHRCRLFLTDNELHTSHNTYNFKWDAPSIAQALKEKKIFPGMMLCYLIVSLYYGMKCLGGFCQVNDLTLTKIAFEKYLKEIGENEEADALGPVQTKELGGDGMVLAYLNTDSGTLIPATGIDMLIDDDETSFKKYVELAKKITLNEAMGPMLPEIYTVLYSVFEREADLLVLQPEQISKITKLEDKIFSVLTHKTSPTN